MNVLSLDGYENKTEVAAKMKRASKLSVSLRQIFLQYLSSSVSKRDILVEYRSDYLASHYNISSCESHLRDRVVTKLPAIVTNHIIVFFEFFRL